MNRSTSRGSVAALIAVAATFVLAAAVAAVSGLAGERAPSDPPASQAPTPVATPAPSYIPTPIPSDAPDGFSFDLDIVTPDDVSVTVDDQTGSLTDARSGQAGDGMSVRWFESIVENVDDDTIRITWVGLPQDDDVAISVSQDGYTVVVSIDQAAPPANSDALGHDRVVEFTFDGPVAADDVEVSVSN